MKKINSIIFVCIFFTTVIFSQSIILNPKYSFPFNNKYSSNQLSLEGLFQLNNKTIEFGVIVGLVNMHYNDQVWQKAINDEFKLFYGVRANLYPFTKYIKKHAPFIGLKLTSVYERPLAYGGGMMVFEPGYYFPNSLNDFMISPIIGTVLFNDFIDIIFEIEYEFRTFNLKYSEYYYDKENLYLESRIYKIEKVLNSIQLNLGLHIEL